MVVRVAAADREGMENPSSHSKAFSASSNISNAPTVHIQLQYHIQL